MSVSMRPRGAPIARFPAPPVVPSLFAGGSARTGSDGGYPWHDGELLYAADLNAAITASAASVLDLGAKGDGVTDDTMALQTALNTYAGKATVLVPDTGHAYLCTGPLFIPSGTDLLLFGWIMARPGSPDTLIKMESVNNVTIRGTGIIDGNRVNNVGQTGAGLSTYQCSNIFLSGITIRNAVLWNLNVVASSHVRVDGVSLIGGMNSNEFAQGCDDCWLTNSLVDGPAGDGGFAFYGGITNSGAIGNIIRHAGSASNANMRGLYILSDSAQIPPCKGIVLSDNIIHNCSGSGIYCDSASGQIHQDIVIANNQCHDNGTSNAGPEPDIGVSSSFNVLIIGNQSLRFGDGTLSQYGIFTGACTGVSVLNNHIGDVGQGGTSGIGMQVAGTNTMFVSGNHFYNLGSEEVTSIGGTAGLQNAYVGNFSELPMALTLQPDSVSANVINGAWSVQGQTYSFSRDKTTKMWNFVDTGSTTFQVAPDGQIFAGSHVNAAGVFRGQAVEDAAGDQVLGSRINGWGTSAAGTRGPISGASTLPQVAAALSQLLRDLTAHGMLGA